MPKRLFDFARLYEVPTGPNQGAYELQIDLRDLVGQLARRAHRGKGRVSQLADGAIRVTYYPEWVKGKDY